MMYTNAYIYQLLVKYVTVCFIPIPLFSMILWPHQRRLLLKLLILAKKALKRGKNKYRNLSLNQIQILNNSPPPTPLIQYLHLSLLCYSWNLHGTNSGLLCLSYPNFLSGLRYRIEIDI